MSSTTLLRTAVRSRSSVLASLKAQPAKFGLSVRYAHGEAESFEAFNDRYAKFFDSVEDLFELQRGLNNCFAYDLVPSLSVVESALKASRRVNDFSTAVRIFEGLKEKVENEGQYKQYVDATADIRKELGVALKEELYA